MNPIVKRYIISSSITFVTAFCGSIVLQLSANIPTDITAAFVLGILGVAGRAAVKVVGEAILGSTGDPSTTA